jgi:hypothetical protein
MLMWIILSCDNLHVNNAHVHNPHVNNAHVNNAHANMLMWIKQSCLTSHPLTCYHTNWSGYGHGLCHNLLTALHRKPCCTDQFGEGYMPINGQGWADLGRWYEAAHSGLQLPAQVKDIDTGLWKVCSLLLELKTSTQIHKKIAASCSS